MRRLCNKISIDTSNYNYTPLVCFFKHVKSPLKLIANPSLYLRFGLVCAHKFSKTKYSHANDSGQKPSTTQRNAFSLARRTPRDLLRQFRVQRQFVAHLALARVAGAIRVVNGTHGLREPICSI